MKRMNKFTALFLAASLLSTTVGALEIQPQLKETAAVYALGSLPQNVQSLLQEQADAVSVQKDDDLFAVTKKQ